MEIEYPEKKRNTKELLPQIVERIFAICKTDEHFPLKNKMTSIDDTLNELQKQIRKQENLVKQSKGLTQNIVTRLSNLKKSNQELRDRLLEALGSES